VISIALGAAVVAQTPQDRIAAIKDTLARNQAALRQYSWVETTTITHKGEVKKQEQKQCSYGADGKVQKTPIPGEAAAKQEARGGGGGRRGGRLAQAIVKEKVDDMKDYLEKAAALVHEYVPPDPQRIQTAQGAGNLDVKPSSASTTLTIKDYVKKGDSLTIGFDPTAKAMRSYAVNSYVEKPKEDAVALAVTFGSLTDGTTYPQQIVLDVTAKQIQVKVTNSGHKKGGV
jgi:hypothetical protein